jgi:hypothetical protein
MHVPDEVVLKKSKLYFLRYVIVWRLKRRDSPVDVTALALEFLALLEKSYEPSQ